MDKKHAGARNELIASVYLLNQGYEVFRNVSQHGDIDLIAMKGGEIFRFDVKSTTVSRQSRAYYGIRMPPEKIAAGIRFLYVMADGTCKIEWTPVSTIGDDGICERCASPFKKVQRNKKFCSDACKSSACSTRLRNRRQEREASL